MLINGKDNGLKIVWPNGKRIAVMLTFDFDADTLRVSRAKSKGKTIGFTDYSRGLYGPNEGLKRCLEVLADYDVKGTFFVPGKIGERYPDKVTAIHRAGHEIGYHGYDHESERGIPKEIERGYMEKSERVLEELIGKKPVGHRAPESILHPFSFELMRERQYLYSSSMKDCDYAYIHEGVSGQRLVELPGDITLDDFTYFYFTFSDPAVRSMYTNREVLEIWKAEFDGLAEEGDKIFCLKLHPQLIGRGSRIAMLGKLIAYMKQHGAWITTCEEVANYVIEQDIRGKQHEMA
ncbi:MAG: polysaccharide deacetylase family protein [Cellulosilyticaceae bacterium]